VLPFENLGDSADAYFADGVSDEVRGKLAGLPTLEVIARTSSSQYHGSDKPPEQVGRELGARYLLTGTVRWDKRPGGTGRVRVSPELIEARTGATRWQQPFEAPLTDLFQVQADIASRVAEALHVALGGGERRSLEERPTADIQAYDLYLRAQAAWLGGVDRDPPSVRRAAGLYRQAVTLDSGFAVAWAGLARTHAQLYALVSPTPQDSAAAHEAAERAMALAPERPEVRVALASFYSIVRDEEPRSLEIAREGLRLAPNDPSLLSHAAGSTMELGRVDEALDFARRARALDPRSAASLRTLAMLRGQARQCPAAVATAESLYAMTPLPGPLRILVVAHLTCSGDLPHARRVIRSAYTRVDRDAFLPILARYGDLYWVADEADRRRMEELSPVAFTDRAAWALLQAELRWLRGDSSGMRAYADTARVEFERVLRSAPDEPETIGLRGLALAYLGRHEEGARDIARARSLHPIERGRIGGVYLLELQARAHVLAGRREEAMDALELILREPYFITPAWLRVDPAYAPLKGNPRFEKLLAGL
jgi:TolB-like protein/Flp pilus assembly protein TadD